MGLVSAGRDIYCLDELAPGRWASGTTLLAQRCYRRLITPGGTLRGGEEEASFGLDMAGFCGRTDPASLSALLPVVVRNELLKDPAVDAVDVTAERIDNAGVVSWTLSISVTGTDGNVDMIVSVSALTVDLLGVT